MRIAEAASHAAIAPPDGDPLMNAFMELGATPWSQRPARPGRKCPRRHYRPVGLDREEAMRASAEAPKYPRVVLDGDDLNGTHLPWSPRSRRRCARPTFRTRKLMPSPGKPCRAITPTS